MFALLCIYLTVYHLFIGRLVWSFKTLFMVSSSFIQNRASVA